VRFLIDADLPRSSVQIIRRYGHEATDVRDIGMGASKDEAIARYAQQEGLCLITGDFDFADLRSYPPSSFPGIVVLVIPGTATSAYILELLERFLEQVRVLPELPGSLAIVEPGRIRLRSE